MILYDKYSNFLGMSSTMLSFLGFEDLEEFKAIYKDVADLFVEKRGYIYKFKNFSWIEYALHSGTPNKKVLITLKNSQVIESELKIKEIYLINPIGESDKFYSVEFVNGFFNNESKSNVIPSPSLEEVDHEAQALLQESKEKYKEPQEEPFSLKEEDNQLNPVEPIGFEEENLFKEEQESLENDFSIKSLDEEEEDDFHTLFKKEDEEQESLNFDDDLFKEDLLKESEEETKEFQIEDIKEIEEIEEQEELPNLKLNEEENEDIFLAPKEPSENEEEEDFFSLRKEEEPLDLFKEDSEEEFKIEDLTPKEDEFIKEIKEPKQDFLKEIDKTKEPKEIEEEKEEDIGKKIALDIFKEEEEKEKSKDISKLFQEDLLKEEKVEEELENIEEKESENFQIEEIKTLDIQDSEENETDIKNEEKPDTKEPIEQSLKESDIEPISFETKEEEKSQKASFESEEESFFSKLTSKPDSDKEDNKKEDKKEQSHSTLLNILKPKRKPQPTTHPGKKFKLKKDMQKKSSSKVAIKESFENLGISTEEERELIEDFIKDIERNISLIQKYIVNKNYTKIADILNIIKSAANILNIKPIANKADIIQEILQEDDIDSLSSHLKEMQEDIEELKYSLEKINI